MDQSWTDVDKALSAWFPPALPRNTAFSESEIGDVSVILRRYQKQSHGRIPHLYITLRLIGNSSTIDDFLDAGCLKWRSSSAMLSYVVAIAQFRFQELWERLLRPYSIEEGHRKGFSTMSASCEIDCTKNSGESTVWRMVSGVVELCRCISRYPVTTK
jgi:hypothetical protein